MHTITIYSHTTRLCLSSSLPSIGGQNNSKQNNRGVSITYLVRVRAERGAVGGGGGEDVEQIAVVPHAALTVPPRIPPR